jgi:hypothetical protein
MVEADVVRRGKSVLLELPVEWLVERYGTVPVEIELMCAGRRVSLRLTLLTSRRARYRARGAGVLALVESSECVLASP